MSTLFLVFQTADDLLSSLFFSSTDVVAEIDDTSQESAAPFAADEYSEGEIDYEDIAVLSKWTAINALVTKSILILFAIVTLTKVYSNKSFRFLKVMIWLILLSSLASILGSVKYLPIMAPTYALHPIIASVIEGFLYLIDWSTIITLFWMLAMKYWLVSLQMKLSVNRFKRFSVRQTQVTEKRTTATAETIEQIERDLREMEALAYLEELDEQ